MILIEVYREPDKQAKQLQGHDTLYHKLAKCESEVQNINQYSFCKNKPFHQVNGFSLAGYCTLDQHVDKLSLPSNLSGKGFYSSGSTHFYWICQYIEHVCHTLSDFRLMMQSNYTKCLSKTSKLTIDNRLQNMAWTMVVIVVGIL